MRIWGKLGVERSAVIGRVKAMKQSFESAYRLWWVEPWRYHFANKTLQLTAAVQGSTDGEGNIGAHVTPAACAPGAPSLALGGWRCHHWAAVAELGR